MRTLLAEVAKHAGEEVEVRGWVHRVRELGKISFLLLRDRSGTAQCVLDGKAEVTPESVVIVRGQVAANDKAPGGFEVQVAELQVVARAEPDLPVPVNQDPDKLSLEVVLDHRMVSLRNPKILSIFKVQATILKHFAEALRGEGFTEIKTSNPPPRSRGLEARPPTPAIPPHRSARRAAARAVGVGQAEPRRMGTPDQEGLRSGPLNLLSLSQPDEGHRRDHRPRAGP